MLQIFVLDYAEGYMIRLQKGALLEVLKKSVKIDNLLKLMMAVLSSKSLQLGNFVSLIVPKSLINAPEFNKTRELLLKHDLLKICDYGEKGFKGVKIETISFLADTSLTKKKRSNN
jgi:hypothetical protein